MPAPFITTDSEEPLFWMVPLNVPLLLASGLAIVSVLDVLAWLSIRPLPLMELTVEE